LRFDLVTKIEQPEMNHAISQV